VSFVLIYKIQ